MQVKSSGKVLIALLFLNQVLATGLSGLYSSLPTKLEEKGEGWHCLLRDDWLLLPPLVQFMNSLEFCNAVIQVRAAKGLPRPIQDTDDMLSLLSQLITSAFLLLLQSTCAEH